ncbi:MAG: hypothetical protein Q7K43_03715 [Candidatus Woesearchaeota archaeon]|nr:hypothetical protein [Candidatus Woesearchaeota archaeon]
MNRENSTVMIVDSSARALSAMAMISIEGNNLQYRTDIGWRDIERSNKIMVGRT